MIDENQPTFSAQDERAQYGQEKPTTKDTARLIWASKPKKEPSPKDLEFQTAEEVYPNKEDVTTKKLSSFWAETPEISDNPNRLIWGDNLLVMQALLAQGYEGQIDLIYIDPPFNTGENFNFSSEVKIGDTLFEKELPVNERLAYTDTWARGIDSFLDTIYSRVQLMQKLLSDNGSIFVHCDWHAGHYLKVILDEIFGTDNFRNELIWHYYNKMQGNINRFASNHDVIFWYSKSKNYTFNKQVEKRDHKIKQLKRVWDKKSGRVVNAKDESGNLIYIETDVRTIDDVWRLSMLQPADRTEKVDYPTQKPEQILHRIISAASNEGELVADFFCGSGTTAAVAEKLGRRWITSDISKTAIQVTRGRLVNQNSKPFIIQNLGNYQRQLIYSKEVKLNEMYNIVLKLYGATPRSDLQGFGTSKDDNKTLVYVCQPDRPMTAKKAVDLAKTARTVDGRGYKNLVILAWDYEYDFDDIYHRMSKTVRKDISEVEFKIIPSDVYRYLRSTNVGDTEIANKITFYQKPYVRLSEPQIINRNKNEIGVKIKIEQYVVMDIPIRDETKRPEIEKLLHKNFANLIDYWTVDWEYDGEVFRSRWQAIRDRKSSEPVPIVAETTLVRGKKYTIAVRVVDIFGNDASMTKEIDTR